MFTVDVKQQQQPPNLQSVIAEVTSHHLSNNAEADNIFARIALDESSIPGPEVIKLFSCSTQLSMKF